MIQNLYNSQDSFVAKLNQKIQWEMHQKRLLKILSRQSTHQHEIEGHSQEMQRLNDNASFQKKLTKKIATNTIEHRNKQIYDRIGEINTRDNTKAQYRGALLPLGSLAQNPFKSALLSKKEKLLKFRKKQNDNDLITSRVFDRVSQIGSTISPKQFQQDFERHRAIQMHMKRMDEQYGDKLEHRVQQFRHKISESIQALRKSVMMKQKLFSAKSKFKFTESQTSRNSRSPKIKYNRGIFDSLNLNTADDPSSATHFTSFKKNNFNTARSQPQITYNHNDNTINNKSRLQLRNTLQDPFKLKSIYSKVDLDKNQILLNHRRQMSESNNTVNQITMPNKIMIV